eukprot:TRINITY_DN14376_c0_g1_i5.p1 TRINITY_DN14376_c0_g1~~TRINITY_DN14376_c0_g1_i5.p1  ORF type:complete len:1096 (-),score=185.30 TRINITY_DN14376_c0_g1_i5:402-3689(-)
MALRSACRKGPGSVAAFAGVSAAASSSSAARASAGRDETFQATGSCRCGAVELTLSVSRTSPWLACSCTTCRHAHAAAWAIFVPVAAGGAVKWKVRKGALKCGKEARCERLEEETSPHPTAMRRSFCSRCGSSVSLEMAGGGALKGRSYVFAGVLDDGSFPKGFVPQLSPAVTTGQLRAPFYPAKPLLGARQSSSSQEAPVRPALRGSCSCRACGFELSQAPTMLRHCHCCTCRKTSGAAFQSWVRAEREHFQWDTAVLRREWRSSPSGKREFCSACGTTLTLVDDKHPKLLWVPAGALEDAAFASYPRGLLDAKHICIKDLPPWNPTPAWLADGLRRIHGIGGTNVKLAAVACKEEPAPSQLPSSIDSTPCPSLPSQLLRRCDAVRDDPIRSSWASPSARTSRGDADGQSDSTSCAKTVRAQAVSGWLSRLGAKGGRPSAPVHDPIRDWDPAEKSSSSRAPADRRQAVAKAKTCRSGALVRHSQNSARGSTASGLARAQSGLSQPDPAAVNQLCELAGCSQAAAEAALQATGQSLDAAALFLVSQISAFSATKSQRGAEVIEPIASGRSREPAAAEATTLEPSRASPRGDEPQADEQRRVVLDRVPDCTRSEVQHADDRMDDAAAASLRPEEERISAAASVTVPVLDAQPPRPGGAEDSLGRPSAPSAPPRGLRRKRSCGLFVVDEAGSEVGSDMPSSEEHQHDSLADGPDVRGRDSSHASRGNGADEVVTVALQQRIGAIKPEQHSDDRTAGSDRAPPSQYLLEKQDNEVKAVLEKQDNEVKAAATLACETVGISQLSWRPLIQASADFHCSATMPDTVMADASNQLDQQWQAPAARSLSRCRRADPPPSPVPVEGTPAAIPDSMDLEACGAPSPPEVLPDFVGEVVPNTAGFFLAPSADFVCTATMPDANAADAADLRRVREAAGMVATTVHIAASMPPALPSSAELRCTATMPDPVADHLQQRAGSGLLHAAHILEATFRFQSQPELFACTATLPDIIGHSAACGASQRPSMYWNGARRPCFSTAGHAEQQRQRAAAARRTEASCCHRRWYSCKQHVVAVRSRADATAGTAPRPGVGPARESRCISGVPPG